MLDEIPKAFLVAAETTGAEDLGSVFLHKRQMIIDKYINSMQYEIATLKSTRLR